MEMYRGYSKHGGKLYVIDHETHKEAQSPMKLTHIGIYRAKCIGEEGGKGGWHIKNEIMRRWIPRSHSHIVLGKCIAGTLHRHLFGSPPRPRRYKVSPVPLPHRVHYHEPTIITVARLAVINHATGMIRLNCCSHVSALEACRADRCMVGKTVQKRRVGAGGSRGLRRGGEESARPFPTTPTTKTGTGERQCPSRAVITHAFQ